MKKNIKKKERNRTVGREREQNGYASREATQTEGSAVLLARPSLGLVQTHLQIINKTRDSLHRMRYDANVRDASAVKARKAASLWPTSKIAYTLLLVILIKIK